MMRSLDESGFTVVFSVCFRPEMKKQASMAIFYEVPHQVDDAQMRAASLHRFLRKRKVR
jgi:hypothetical protein